MSPNSVSDLHSLFGIKWKFFFNINLVLCFEKNFRKVDRKKSLTELAAYTTDIGAWEVIHICNALFPSVHSYDYK